MSAHELNIAHITLYPRFGVNPPIEWFDDDAADEESDD
jgi:hypothetical protein